ncbi:MAG TPA: hypothetical protein VIC51_12895 [Psychromonas sp.]
MKSNKIKRSSWVMNQVYFKVKLVPDFERKFKSLIIEDNNFKSEDDLNKHYNENGELDKFIERILKCDFIEIYQFPFEYNSNNCETVDYEMQADYFERIDDDFSIHRSLFLV